MHVDCIFQVRYVTAATAKSSVVGHIERALRKHLWPNFILWSMNFLKMSKCDGYIYFIFFSSTDMCECRIFSYTIHTKGLIIMFYSFKEGHLKCMPYSIMLSLDNLKSVTYYIIITCILQSTSNFLFFFHKPQTHNYIPSWSSFK